MNFLFFYFVAGTKISKLKYKYYICFKFFPSFTFPPFLLTYEPLTFLLMDTVYLQKSIKAEVDDIDEKAGIITGYASIFGNIDSDRDMIVSGAYTKTLRESGKRARHLWQHSTWQPLARPELKEDNKGLWFKSKISQTSYGKDALQLYIDGVIDEHSVGIRPTRTKQQAGYNELLEVQLWEISSVTWGANSSALVESVKGMTKEDIFAKMDRLLKAFRNGKYENEEIFDLLEIHHKQLQQTIIDLTNNVPAAGKAPEQATPAAEEAPVLVKEVDYLGVLNKINLLSNSLNYVY